MSWIDKKNIKRIFNAFKRSKDKIYNEDIEALKQLNESVDNNSESYTKDNLLFAKLLCIQIRLNLEYYKDIKMAIKKSNDDLKMPLNGHLQYLTISLNNIENVKYFKSIGIDFDSYKNENEIIKLHQKQIIEKLQKCWNLETVEKSFYNFANDFLKDVENYK